MVARPFGLRGCAAMLFSALVLVTGLGCHKSKAFVSASGTFALTGNITYIRKPLHFDVDGKPTGVETDATKFAAVPARGLNLRVFQSRPQINPDYSTTYVWTQVAAAVTDTSGNYSITNTLQVGYPTFMEIVSVTSQYASPASVITIDGDPASVYSSAQITDRPLYVMRRNLDGTVVADPTKVASGTKDTVLNVAVGLDDNWYLAAPKWWVPAQAGLPTAEPDPIPAGSRPLAIMDSFYYFSVIYGNVVPAATAAALDMHYRPGVSVKRGTFVEYNSANFPKSYDGSAFHYFGAVSGGGVVDGVTQSDDAYDLGTLYPIMGRNFMYGQRKSNLIPTGQPATSLAPDLVLIEGFGDAMAATLLNRPYLPAGGGGDRYAALRDIRDLSALSPAEISAFSAPAVTALTWDLALINTGITGAGTATDWAKIVSINLLRYYKLQNPTMLSGTATVIADCPSLFTQLARLQEAKASTDNSDLLVFFPDTVLVPLCAKYNIKWTTAANAILPTFTTNWGIDPNTLTTPLPSFPLSMGLATQIERYALDGAGVEQATSYYPDNSRNEVVYAMFALSLDMTYNLKVECVPALPAGAAIELLLDANMQTPYLFTATSAQSIPLTLKGNPGDLTTPVWHLVRVRMYSPDVQVPGTQVTVKLERTN